MKIDTIRSNNQNDINIDGIKVEPFSETFIGDVKRLLFQTNPSNRNISVDNAYVLYISKNNSPCILGVVCIEPNDVGTKHLIQETDIEKRNYHEFTYLLIDERLFNKETLIPLLRQTFSMCVSNEPIDEVFWFSHNLLYSRIINKMFKTYNVYYFINEATYFAEKIVSVYKEELERQLNNAMPYRMEDIDEINEYMWLKPDLTNLDVDIFVDDGGAYLRHNHELLLFARNGYGRGIADFIPFSISNKPRVLDVDMNINISSDVILSIQDFIQANMHSLKSLADKKISQEEFAQNINKLKTNLSFVDES